MEIIPLNAKLIPRNLLDGLSVHVIDWWDDWRLSALRELNQPLLYLTNIESDFITHTWWLITIFQEIHYSLFVWTLAVCYDAALGAFLWFDRTFRRLAGYDAFNVALDQSFKLNRTNGQMFDTDSALAVVSKARSRILNDGKFNLVIDANFTALKKKRQEWINQMKKMKIKISTSLRAVTSILKSVTLTVSSTSVKWKNRRTLRSTQRRKPKPSFNDATTPCSRFSPLTWNVSSSREMDVARCNWSRRSVASKNCTQSPWRSV